MYFMGLSTSLYMFLFFGLVWCVRRRGKVHKGEKKLCTFYCVRYVIIKIE